jgi:hypothetical protein
MPETNGVYVVPDIGADLFFWNGWWWRPWEGGWYRSRYYDRGWGYYAHVPRFYFDVEPGWRGYYRDHNWYGHRWDYQRIPPQQLHQNWKSWQTDRHWERQGTWGVQNYHPQSEHQRQELREQRQQQYRQGPEVQQHQHQGPPQGRSPQGQHQRPPHQVEQPRPHPQERGQWQQRQEQRPHQAQQTQYSQPHGKENQKEGR